MKADMAGAATVLGAIVTAARLALPIRVTAWLALAENMPGADAQRPSDVITMFDGTTVEVTNTDAEGRLVMADALARAVTEEPDAVLDVATLTGAQIVALGDHVAAVMGTPDLREEVVAAQLINSVVDPTKANATPNPFANKLTVVSDPELTNKEEWYLAAAPGILPTVEVTYLNGNEAPTMESHISFKNLGIEWRIYLDFGVNLLDFRGILKSSGK